MEKLVNKVLNTSIEGYTLYYRAGSFWLINSTTNQWVIKVGYSGYTYYNYFFFHGIFSYLSLDVIKDKKYIYDWIVNELGFIVSEHYYPDYLPGEYDWRKDFEVDLVIEYGKIIDVRPDSLRSMESPTPFLEN
jgi:hypothetical protein